MPMVRMGKFLAQADGCESSMIWPASAPSAASAPSVGEAATPASAPMGSVPLGMELRRLPPRRRSWLFSLPAATLGIYGVEAGLSVQVREPGAAVVEFVLGHRDSYLAPAASIVQLCNDTEQAREVLLVTSPGRVVELEGKRVTHDDSVVVGRSWDEPTAEIAPYEVAAQRAEALRRRAAKRGHAPPLASVASVASLASVASVASVASLASVVSVASVASLASVASGASTVDGRDGALVSGERSTLMLREVAPDACTLAVRHRSVEQLWHVLQGGGMLWRAQDGESRIDKLVAGDSLCIPPGVQFQVRAGDEGLRALVTSAPGWPGPHEAVAVRGAW
jgi:mannose-6-phosphate isomerase-like protein (cupin superfamily)